MNCQELQEELTVQEVILDSLQGETFEGVEQDREEAQAEISRLKRALKALRKAKKDEQGTKQEKKSLLFTLSFFFTSILLTMAYWFGGTDMMLLDGQRVTPQRGMGSDVPATPGKQLLFSIFSLVPLDAFVQFIGVIHLLSSDITVW